MLMVTDVGCLAYTNHRDVMSLDGLTQKNRRRELELRKPRKNLAVIAGVTAMSLMAASHLEGAEAIAVLATLKLNHWKCARSSVSVYGSGVMATLITAAPSLVMVGSPSICPLPPSNVLDT